MRGIKRQRVPHVSLYWLMSAAISNVWPWCCTASENDGFVGMFLPYDAMRLYSYEVRINDDDANWKIDI